MSDEDKGNSTPSPKAVASWGGLGGGVIGGLTALFASASHGDATAISTGVWTIIGGTVVGILTAASAFIVAYLNNATKMQREIGDLREQISKLRENAYLEISALRLKHDTDSIELRSKLTDSLLREKDLKYDLERAQRRIEILENEAGITHPQQVYGVIIADFNGIVQEFSLSLTPALGWLPEQMQGQSIQKLIPSDIADAHQTRFKDAVKPGVVIDHTKKINTYALDKNGKRVPVSISLRKWTGDTQLITATVMIRPSASAGDIKPGTPQRRITDV